MTELTTVQQIAVDELDPARAYFYWQCRLKGTSHNLAVIFASGKAPAMDRRDERQVRNGVNGTYQAGLARYPGDPAARCTSVTGPNSDFARKCEEQGKLPFEQDAPRGVPSMAMPKDPTGELPPYTDEEERGFYRAAKELTEHYAGKP